MPQETPQSPSLEALRKLIETADVERVTKKDFENLARQIIDLVKADKAVNGEKRTELAQMIQSMLSQFETRLNADMEEIRASVQAVVDEKTNKLTFDHEAFLSEARAVLDNVRDGEDADETVIVDKVLALLPPKEELEEETALTIADKLDTLSEEDQLKAIKDLQKQIDELKRRPHSVGGGVVRLNSLSDLIITPSGTIDDSNVTFTFSWGKPQMVNVNGAFYLEGSGWSFTGGNVVLDAPAGSGGKVFGIK